MEVSYRILPKDWDVKTESLAHTKDKKYKRRVIFDGWNNYTSFEKEMIAEVKSTLKNQTGIDLSQYKNFGPRVKDNICIPGTSKIINGRDIHLRDDIILRILHARGFDMKLVIENMKYHLEWRQTNVPRPVLSDKVLNLINSGMMYIHGRCMD